MRCKPTTAGGYRYALDKVLLPAFGSPPLGASAAIRWRLCTIGSTRRRPWRTGWWACSRGCFNMAEAWGMALEGGNPCRSVKKYRNRNCKRFPSKQESRRLGRVLSEVNPRARCRGVEWRLSGC